MSALADRELHLGYPAIKRHVAWHQLAAGTRQSRPLSRSVSCKLLSRLRLVSVDVSVLYGERCVVHRRNVLHMRRFGMVLLPAPRERERFAQAFDGRRVGFVPPGEQQAVVLW